MVVSDIPRPYRGVVHDLERRHKSMPKHLDGFDSVWMMLQIPSGFHTSGTSLFHEFSLDSRSSSQGITPKPVGGLLLAIQAQWSAKDSGSGFLSHSPQQLLHTVSVAYTGWCWLGTSNICSRLYGGLLPLIVPRRMMGLISWTLENPRQRYLHPHHRML